MSGLICNVGLRKMSALPYQFVQVPAMIRSFPRWFAGAHFVCAVMVVVSAAFVARVVVWPACWLIDSVSGSWAAGPMQQAGASRIIFEGLLLAPLMESLVGQLLVFRMAAKFRLFPARPWLTIVLSSVIFGAMHFYSAGYILSATAVGLVLAAAFAFAGAGARAYWIIAVAHAFINAVAAVASIRSA
jgi:hypothetical protein